MLATSGGPWRAVVTRRGLAKEARRVSRDVMVRLADPDVVEGHLAAVWSAKSGARPVNHGVAQGFAGVALAFGHLDRCYPEEGWDVRAHEHLLRAAESAANGVRTLGLFSGLSGLAFVASYLSKGGRYGHFLSGLESELLRELKAPRKSKTEGVGLPVSEYDLISGWTGIGVHFLSRPPGLERNAVLEALSRRTVAVVDGARGIPTWFTAGEQIIDPDLRRRYPGGVINCGLAHGVPGPLSFMSLVAVEPSAAQGLQGAIRTTADWLLAHVLTDDWGKTFPSVVPADPSIRPTPARNAWCYGSPGVASALFHAAEALGDKYLRDIAVDLVESALRRPPPARRIDSPGFCHGIAGLLQVAVRTAARTGSLAVADGVHALVEQLVDLYEPDSMIGYRTIEADGERVDQPGLLEGVPGVALALLAAATDVAPAWDRMFLLS